MHSEQMDMKKKILKMNLRYLPEGPLREMFTSVKSLAAIQATKVSFSFRIMHFFATEQTCGFQAHHYTSHLAFNPSVPTHGPLYNTPHCGWGR